MSPFLEYDLPESFFLAVLAMICFTSLQVRSGYAPKRTAIPPATVGAAEEVPLNVDV